MVVLTELIFNSFLLWEGVVVLKKLNFKICYFGRPWCGLESTELRVSTLVGYGGLENTDF